MVYEHQKAIGVAESLTGYASDFVDVFHNILAAWLDVSQEGR